jgi:hypothetical protein
MVSIMMPSSSVRERPSVVSLRHLLHGVKRIKRWRRCGRRFPNDEAAIEIALLLPLRNVEKKWTMCGVFLA